MSSLGIGWRCRGRGVGSSKLGVWCWIVPDAAGMGVERSGGRTKKERGIWPPRERVCLDTRFVGVAESNEARRVSLSDGGEGDGVGACTVIPAGTFGVAGGDERATERSGEPLRLVGRDWPGEFWCRRGINGKGADEPLPKRV